MNTLPFRISSRYNRASQAKTCDGFRSSIIDTGAPAPIVLLGAFFVPRGFSFGSTHWEAFGLAGYLYLRSANPMCAATIILFRSNRCQLIYNKIQGDTTMSNSIFSIQDGVLPSDIRDYISDSSQQIHSLSCAAMQLMDDGDFDRIQLSHLLWLLCSLSSCQLQAIEADKRLPSVPGEVQL